MAVSDIKTGLPIQFEVGIAKLRDADLLAAEDGKVTQESLELAAGLMALALSATNNDLPEVPSLSDRISERRTQTSDGEPWVFVIEDVLDAREAAFLPTARTIVGLTYQAARFNTQTRLRPRRS